MPEVFKKLAQGLLGNTSATLYTAPASTVGIVRSFRLVNVDSVDHTVTLYQDGADDGHTLLKAVTIPAGGSADNDDVQIVDAAGTIRGFADTANKVSYYIGGLEVS